MRIHHATIAKAKKFKITLTVEDNEVVATDAKGNRLAAGLQGNKVLDEAITRLTGHPAKKGQDNTAKKARAKAKRAPRDEEEEEDGEEETSDESEAAADEGDAESEADQSGTIVKHKYKERYKANGGNCGDDIAKQISEHVAGTDGKTDKKKLQRFAEANGAWVPAYASLPTKSGGWNAGLARMNVSNRIRAKVRRAKAGTEEFEIQWV